MRSLDMTAPCTCTIAASPRWRASPPTMTETRGQRNTCTVVRGFVCRLDVCWTLFFFLFLACVAVLTTSVTQSITYPHVLSTWHTLHHFRIRAANTRINQAASKLDQMAVAFLSMHLHKSLPMESEHTLELACSVLWNYDKDLIVRAFVPASLAKAEMVACIHSMQDSGSLRTLTGYVSHNHTINGTYLVDTETMGFVRPLRKMTEQPADRRNVTYNLVALNELSNVMDLGRAYYNGSIDSYDKRVNWVSPPSMPHLLYYNLPVSMMARGLNVNRSLDDYVQVRIDGSRILIGNQFRRTPGLSIAAFIYQSLNDSDPQVLATSWGQAAVSNTSIFQSTNLSSVEYLTVSGISDPLMRAALKHVSFRSLQRPDCNESVDFRLHGGTATVTAFTYTTSNGCVLRLVYAGSHAVLVGPYGRKRDVCNGVLLLAVFLFTALFWRFVHTQFSVPLFQLTRLMLHNLETGTHTVYVAAASTWMRLKEVRQLTLAHNRAVRRLQQIKLFIPAAVRNFFSQPTGDTRYHAKMSSEEEEEEEEGDPSQLGRLTSQTLTAVYVMLRPAPKLLQPREPLKLPLPRQIAAPQAAAAPAADRASTLTTAAGDSSRTSNVNSGPFSSPAVLEAFVEAVYELSAQHHGVVHRLCPDNCIVHFGKAARATQSSGASPGGGNEIEMTAMQDAEIAIRSDARDAMAFVWALDDFLDRIHRRSGVEAHMLVDTTTFVCGHYRAKRSEHVLRVALGRDVRRDFGSLLPSLGIRIAMTEETAMRVRAEWNGRLEPGVRQLPVEAISTGRAGSNKHAVLLYEALRGSVAGDHVWQSYAHCCFKGFSCMLRGEYAKALEAYSRIREISDLETGLMPACLGREAAPSFATGGAISTQVNRLMKECRRCVAQHITRGYCRTRRAPPGVGSTTHADLNAAGQGAVAAAPSTLSSSQAALATFQPQKQRRSRQQPRIAPAATGVWSPSRGLPDAVPAAPFSLPVSAESRQRYLVTTFDASGAAMRHVLGDPPHRIRDNFGCKWTLSQPFRCVTGGSVDNVYVVGLSSTGAPCYASQLILREVRSIVSRAVNGAPDGFLTDALRSAVPVRDPTPQQRAQLRAVVNTHCTLSHPSLLLPTAYSLSVEGVVVLLYPFFPGCSMRELLRRYPRMSPFTATGFTLPALTALAHMHAENIAHGAFSLDNIIAAPDGSSRLITRCCGHRVARELCAVPPTCYVSPAMAAGAAPTPACDVFCYGLMCLEILTRGRVWKWAAPAGEAGSQQRTATELTALLADCGKPFCDAVAQGVLVPDMDVLDEVVSTNLYREVMTATVRACLSFDPTQRPTAKQLCAVTRILASREAGAVQPSCLQGKKGTD